MHMGSKRKHSHPDCIPTDILCNWKKKSRDDLQNKQLLSMYINNKRQE